jgi:hypothetical protein
MRSSLTAVGLAGALSTLVLTGCGESDGDPIEWNRGSTDLVLQLRTLRSLEPTGVAGQLPNFSLYGDGMAVRGGKFGPTTAHLDDDAVAGLLAEAAELADDAATGAAGPDATVVRLRYTADGATHTVDVPSTDPDVERLLRRATDAGADVTPYAAPAVAVLATSGAGAEPAPWPLGTLEGGTTVGGSYCSLLNGDRARRAVDLAMTSPDSAWTSGGRAYAVAVRPLLPDEQDCSDLD